MQEHFECSFFKFWHWFTPVWNQRQQVFLASVFSRWAWNGNSRLRPAEPASRFWKKSRNTNVHNWIQKLKKQMENQEHHTPACKKFVSFCQTVYNACSIVQWNLKKIYLNEFSFSKSVLNNNLSLQVYANQTENLAKLKYFNLTMRLGKITHLARQKLYWEILQRNEASIPPNSESGHKISLTNTL